jgi:spore coat polysaccharide biosynthesis protein SpsF
MMIDTLAIIQARSGSTRFPNKVTADLCGKTVIQRTAENVEKSKQVDTYVIAMPHGESQLVVSQGYIAKADRCDSDVLGRFGDCLRQRSDLPRYVVRVCADNPLIWPRGIDYLVRLIKATEAEYAGYVFENGMPAIQQANGYFAEVCTADSLLYADATLPDDAPQREHVTQWLYESPDIFKSAWALVPDWYDGDSMAIDTPEDLERVRRKIEAGDVPCPA